MKPALISHWAVWKIGYKHKKFKVNRIKGPHTDIHSWRNTWVECKRQKILNSKRLIQITYKWQNPGANELAVDFTKATRADLKHNIFFQTWVSVKLAMTIVTSMQSVPTLWDLLPALVPLALEAMVSTVQVWLKTIRYARNMLNIVTGIALLATMHLS